MYRALGTGLRASQQRPPARLICRRRYPSPSPSPSPQRTRSFHASRALAREPTPPADPDSKPVDDHGLERNNEDPPAEPAPAAADDPDLLAQKLQRSREMARRYSSALRRTQRRNRAHDLPPVVVPDWFVQQCVVRHEQAPAQAVDPRRGAFTLALRRRDTGEVARCSIPVQDPDAIPRLVSEFVSDAWGGSLGDLDDFVSKLGDGSIGSPKEQPSSSGSEPTSTAGEKHESNKARLEALKQEIAQLAEAQSESQEHQHIQRLRELSKGFDSLSDEIKQRIAPFVLDTDTDQMNAPTLKAKHIPPCVLAEIRAIMAASLSVLQPSSSDAFPAAKTNLILHCPSSMQDRLLEDAVLSVAGGLGVDTVILRAQDLAELAGDYLGDGPEPSPHSIRSLGYETHRPISDASNSVFLDVGAAGKDDRFAADEDEETSAFGLPSLKLFGLDGFLNGISRTPQPSAAEPSQKASNEAQLEDLKIANLIEHLIDAAETQRERGFPDADADRTPSSSDNEQATDAPRPDFFDYSINPACGKFEIDTALPSEAVSRFGLAVHVGSSSRKSCTPSNAKIIYVPDYKELKGTHYGSRVIQRLEECVRKRRIAGESIMIVGSSSSPDLTPDLTRTGIQSLQAEGEESFYRTIVVPVERVRSTLPKPLLSVATGNSANAYDKYQRINVRHIQNMLRCLDPLASRHISDRETSDNICASLTLANAIGLGRHLSMGKILTYDEVHRIALTALGLHLVDPVGTHLNGTHVVLALGLLQASDHRKFAYIKRQAQRRQSSQGSQGPRGAKLKWNSGASSARDRERQLERIWMTATKHEKRLMPGIANPDQIKTTFDQIHVPPDTIDAIRTLTSLSLLRPDAFDYGVLATEKISGALLYGPPGTGKTLLAKAVAKESGSSVLEVSGSQIMDKYVGEGEKNVTAIFSLARKLSPCVVFLDEADAIFSSRDMGRDRNTHRDILNQFLKEWDGLNDLSVFVMVATNRPFDLDDAVIRRLPRRLLVDLPTQTDRWEILKIHLRGEQLDESVDLVDIAKRTPFYSGSDLKNLAVSAALACVKEENEQAAIAAAQKVADSLSTEVSPSDAATAGAASKPPQLVRGMQYDFPVKRVLCARHFDRALQEISASISEDMSSLNAIKKFDEKYGDKKGKKQKRVFGIGIDKGLNENVVRVRT